MHDQSKEKSVNWEAITPEELRPAVSAIHKSFGDASWRCRESARKLCFVGLHPTLENQQATNLAIDLNPYKNYLIAAIGDQARDVIAKPNRTPPAIFKAYLDLYRIGLIAVIRDLFDETLQVAIAQRSILKWHPVNWATSHLELLIDNEKSSVHLWIKRVCDTQEYPLSQREEDFDEAIFWRTWRAPRLIRMDPAGSSPYDAATAWEREDENTSQRMLESHCKIFVFSCHSDLQRSARVAHVQLAQRPIAPILPSTEKSREAPAEQITSPRHKDTPSLGFRSELKRAVSFLLVLNPEATDQEICRRLDADGIVELPGSLTNSGRDRLYMAAYRDPQRRHKLELTFSKVRKIMRDKGLLRPRQRS